MPTLWFKVAELKSASKPGEVHVVAIGTNGLLGCDCWGWRTSLKRKPDLPQHCTHTTTFRDYLTGVKYVREEPKLLASREDINALMGRYCVEMIERLGERARGLREEGTTGRMTSSQPNLQNIPKSRPARGPARARPAPAKPPTPPVARAAAPPPVPAAPIPAPTPKPPAWTDGSLEKRFSLLELE